MSFYDPLNMYSPVATRRFHALRLQWDKSGNSASEESVQGHKTTQGALFLDQNFHTFPRFLFVILLAKFSYHLLMSCRVAFLVGHEVTLALVNKLSLDSVFVCALELFSFPSLLLTHSISEWASFQCLCCLARTSTTTMPTFSTQMVSSSLVTLGLTIWGCVFSFYTLPWQARDCAQTHLWIVNSTSNLNFLRHGS